MTDKELRILISVYNALQDELGNFENVIHENTDQGYFQDMLPILIARLVKDSPDYNPDDLWVRATLVNGRTRLVSTNDPMSWLEKEFFGI